jgi:hypothetical protein
LSLGGESSAQLGALLIAKELDSQATGAAAPNERTERRLASCYEYIDLGETSGRFLALLKLALRTTGEAFSFWRPLIAHYCTRAQSEFLGALLNETLEIARSKTEANSTRDDFYGLIVELIEATDESQRQGVIREFFELCKHERAESRSAAIGVMDRIETLANEKDWRLGINKLARDLCALKAAEAASYDSSFDAILRYPGLLTDVELRDIVALAVRLLQEESDQSKNFGIHLVMSLQRMPPGESELSDLVHVLGGLASVKDDEVAVHAVGLLKHLASHTLDDAVRSQLSGIISGLDGDDS